MAEHIKGITVEIGADLTGLSKAMKGVNKEINQVERDLKKVESALKIDPSNVDLLQQKEKLLGEEVKRTEDKVGALRQAKEEADRKMQEGTKVNEAEYRNLVVELAKSEQKLKDLQKESKEFGSVGKQQAEAVAKKFEDMGNKFEDAGKKLAVPSAVATGLVTAAVTTAASFESSMSQVQATMGISKEAMSELDGQSVNTMDALEALAQQMGSETAFSASQCGDAINYLALAGYDTQQVYDTLPTVLNLAAAGGMDLASASDMVTDAMSALGLEVEDAEVMVDQMAKTASSTNTSVAQLGEAILTIGGTAKTLAGGTTELNTALGILANNGIKASEGGTHLRNVIMSLQNPTQKAEDAMQSLGIDVWDAAGNMRPMNDILGDLNKAMSEWEDSSKQGLISTIFNKTDIAAVNALLANTGETWASLEDTIANSEGAAAEMAATQLDNLQGQLTYLGSALEGLAISMGKLLLPAVKAIASGFQFLVGLLNSMPTPIKAVIAVLGVLVAASAPMLIIVGKVISSVGTIIRILPMLTTAVKALFGVLADHPIGIIIGLIAAVIMYLVNLYNSNEEFRNKVNALWASIKEKIGGAIEAIKTAISGMITKIQTIITTVINIKNKILEQVAKFKEVGVNLVEGLWKGIQGAKQWLLNKVKEWCGSILNGIKAFFGIHSPAKATEDVGYHLDTGLAKGLTNNLDVVENATEKVGNTVKDTLNDVFGARGINLSDDLASELLTALGLDAGATLSVGADDTDLEKILAELDEGATAAIETRATGEEELLNSITQATAEYVGQAMLAGLAQLGGVLAAAMPENIQLQLNGRELAKASWGDYETLAQMRARIFAPSKAQIAAIAASVGSGMM